MTSRTWLITGTSRGLGRALVEAVLGTGDAVVATVRGDDQLPSHPRLTVLRLDVRDREAAFDVVARAHEVTGRIDVLVNNAGYGLIGAVEEVGEDEARAIIDTDLLGPLWLSQAVLPVMRAQQAGHIIQISTVGAVGTMPALGLYNAAKWGLEGFTEAMAAEVARFGIRVTLVQPGEIDTDWAGASMRFATPLAAYDALRSELFGSAVVPWPMADEAEQTEQTEQAKQTEQAERTEEAERTEPDASGLSPAAAATAILAHVVDPDDARRRLMLGEDAPAQVAAALDARLADYEHDPRFARP